VRAIVITAFVNGNVIPFFPFKQCVTAVRAEIFNLTVVLKPLIELEEITAEFAFKLRMFFTVVKV
jgi:hypothetical protein